jgi:hypothetical protein
MTEFTWTTDFVRQVRAWLKWSLNNEDLQSLVSDDDPLRDWWKPEAKDLRFDLLLDVILGGRDYVTLLAFIQYARTKEAAPPLPFEVDLELTRQLARLAHASRTSARHSDFHAFVSYSHRDVKRATILLSVLKSAGLRIFHDVEHIQPGESIIGRLHDIMSRTPRAILLISESYVASDWARRELDTLVARHRSGKVALLPVLLDDVPLPTEIADVFTIDLRGFKTSHDQTWAERRLQRLIAVCQEKG